MDTTHLNAPRSVLFIGNSYTYCNDLPSLFGEIARSRGYELQIRSVTKGGHTLEGHADPADECGAKLEALLQSERFDAVFLQEFSVRPALDDKTPFFNAVRTLCARLRRTGIAAEQGCLVSPVGTAFYAVHTRHPEIALYTEDCSHPSLTGSYLAALCHFASLYGDSPLDVDYAPAGVDSAVAELLRQAAAKAVSGPSIVTDEYRL